MTETKNNIERKINPDLPMLKKDWEGNVVIKGRFCNDTVPDNFPFTNILKWTFSRNPQREEKRSDTFQLQTRPFDRLSMRDNSIVWLGHASFLMNINGVSLITDPCFFNLPINRKRKAPLPCSIDSLKPIDYLLISHDHRDHFDEKSVEALIEHNPDMEALIPLGGSRLFSGKKLNGVKRQEAGWYQEYKLTASLRIIFLPARHWGRRGFNDLNKTLWGSFLIISDKTKIFFAGDSAYDELLFKEIRNLFGDIDICILPIGAYMPEFIMKRSHTSPEEAVQVFSDLGGKIFIPMHYGTYDLSDEPTGEPIVKLQKCGNDKRIDDRIKQLIIGEEYLFRLNDLLR
ncbi:MAG: MBL fold metallo-hydrolase [Leptospirales bacterium]|nr:MBL fold metallo-hydrolase [Leptospirales bacterium]